MIYIMKKYLIKFLAFYVVRKDYRRMRCSDKQNAGNQNDDDDFKELDGGKMNAPQNKELNLVKHGSHPVSNPFSQRSSLNNSQTLQPRHMNQEEIHETFINSITTNMRIYHPLIGILSNSNSQEGSSLFTKLRNTIRLSKTINVMLFISGMIVSLTLALALSFAFCGVSGTLGYSIECQLESIGAVVIIDALLSVVIMLFLTKICSFNYLEFLQQIKLQSNQPKLDKQQREYQESLRASIGIQDQLNEVASQSIKMRNVKQSQTPGNDTQVQPALHPQQQQQYLYSIKEDDEEAPLSPEKHSLDDIGSDELSPGKPKNVRDVTILPPLGLMRTMKNDDYQNQSLIKLQKLRASASAVPDIGNVSNRMNNSRATDGHNETYSKSKSMSHSQVTHQGEIIYIEDERNQQNEKSFSNAGGLNQSKQSIRSNNGGFNSSSKFDPAVAYQNKQPMNENYRVLTAPGLNINSESSTLAQTMEHGGFLKSAQGSNLNEENKQQIPPINEVQFGPEPSQNEFNGSFLNNGFDFIEVDNGNNQNAARFLNMFKLLFGSALFIAILLSPFYVIQQLSTLSSLNLGQVLLTFLYSILLDYLAVRPISIIIASLIDARLELKRKCFMTNTKTPQSDLTNDQLSLLGEFYQDYDQGFLTTGGNSSEEEFAYETHNTPPGGSGGNIASSEEDEFQKHPSQGSGRQLLNKSIEKAKISLVMRTHQTRIPGIVLIEHWTQEPIYLNKALFQVGENKNKALSRAVQGDLEKGELVSTSHRLMGISQCQVLSNNYKTPGTDIQYGPSFAACPDDMDENAQALKMMKPPIIEVKSKNAPTARYEVNSDDIEEIEADSAKKNRVQSRGGSTFVGMADSSISLDPTVQGANGQAPSQRFETPKLTPEQQLRQFQNSFIRDTNPNAQVGEGSSRQNITTSIVNYTRNMGTQGRNKETPDINPDDNQSQLDQKKKLLRDMILEASSSDTKKNKGKNESSREEFRSLKKYLADDSYEQPNVTDQNGNSNQPRIQNTLLNESDIAALWNNNINANGNVTNEEYRTHKTDHFSPKYSSGNKSSIHRVQTKVGGPGSKNTAAFNGVKGDSVVTNKGQKNQDGSLTRQPVHAGQKGHARSSSHHSNLLRSVLSQNREQECDFSEIIKQSQRENAKEKRKSFNSPQAKDRTPPLESVSKKKYASIIVQGDNVSPRPNMANNEVYEDVQVQEEYDDLAQTAEDHAEYSRSPNEGFIVPTTVNKQQQPKSNSHISIVQFQSEKDRMPKEEQFEKMYKKIQPVSNTLNNGSINSSLRNSSVSPAGRVQQSPPKSQHSGSQPSNQLKPKVPANQLSKRTSNQGSFRNNNLMGSLGSIPDKNELFEIKESAEFQKGSLAKPNNQNNTKVYPEKSLTHSRQASEPKSDQLSNNRSSAKISGRVFPITTQRRQENRSPTHEPIIEEKSLETGDNNNNDSTPTPSPPKIINHRGQPLPEKQERKVISFLVLQDNAFVGNVSGEPAEITALRRSKYQTENGNQSLRPSSLQPEDMMLASHSNAVSNQIEIEVNPRRHTSNIRPSNMLKNAPIAHRVQTSQSNTRIAQNNQVKRNNQVSTFQSLQSGQDTQIKKVTPPVPVVYNLNLKVQEEQQRKKDEVEVNRLIMEEQRRQLKKVLQLTRQLRKGKDEKKIKELIHSMKDSGKPLPLQQINELRMLEIMSSPYSQPLQGMIKIIEASLKTNEERDAKPASVVKKDSKKQFSRSDGLSQKPTNTLQSSRKLQAVVGLYGQQNTQNNQYQSNFGSSLSRMSLSRESSTDSMILGSHYKPPLRVVKTRKSPRNEINKNGSSLEREQRSLSKGSSKSSRERRRSPSPQEQILSSKKSQRKQSPEVVDITDQSEHHFERMNSNPFSNKVQSRESRFNRPNAGMSASSKSRSHRSRSATSRSNSLGKEFPELQQLEGIEEENPQPHVSRKNYLQQTNSSANRRKSQESSSKREKPAARKSKKKNKGGSMLSPTDPPAMSKLAKRGAALMSNYSSINQVLIEHEDEGKESIIETHQMLSKKGHQSSKQKLDFTDENILSKQDSLGSKEGGVPPVVVEIDEHVDSYSIEM